MTRQGSILDTVHMEFGYWAAWPPVPDSYKPELCILNFNVQLVVFLLSIEIFFIKKKLVYPHQAFKLTPYSAFLLVRAGARGVG